MNNLLFSPSLVRDSDDVSPPAFWNGSSYVIDAADIPFLMNVGNGVDPFVAGDTLAAAGTISHQHVSDLFLLVVGYDALAVGTLLASASIPAGVVTPASFSVSIEGYVDAAVFLSETSTGASTYASGFDLDLTLSPNENTQYNCDCDDDFPTETLAALREKVLIEMGYSAQLANPPANVVRKINQALEYAQKFAYQEFYDSKLERFFTWNMVEGTRFYDIPQNADACTKKLNTARITWVGVQENNDRWYPMVFGIPPEFYTEPQITTRPNRYEIRQCIEVWPAPGDGSYRLRIKGEVGLLRFTEDTDITTIDPDVIFYGACFRLMRRRGDADADDYAAMQQRRMEQITEAGHFTARYVPGVTVVADQPRPIFPFMED